MAPVDDTGHSSLTAIQPLLCTLSSLLSSPARQSVFTRQSVHRLVGFVTLCICADAYRLSDSQSGRCWTLFRLPSAACIPRLPRANRDSKPELKEHGNTKECPGRLQIQQDGIPTTHIGRTPEIARLQNPRRRLEFLPVSHSTKSDQEYCFKGTQPASNVQRC